jgi:hypothetical protein
VSPDVLVGALLSVPIGIGTILVTPSLQRRLERWSTSRERDKLRKAREEHDRIAFYNTNPNELTQYMVIATIKIATIIAFLTLIEPLVKIDGIVLAALGISIDAVFDFDILGYFEDLIDSAPSLASIAKAVSPFFLLYQVILLVGTLIIINICRLAISTWTRARNFPVDGAPHLDAGGLQ